MADNSIKPDMLTVAGLPWRSVAAANTVGEEAIIAQVHEFTEYFDHEFGSHHPPFSVGTFEDAMEAARSTYKLLLIYLHDRNNMACDLFARCVHGCVARLRPPH